MHKLGHFFCTSTLPDHWDIRGQKPSRSLPSPQRKTKKASLTLQILPRILQIHSKPSSIIHKAAEWGVIQPLEARIKCAEVREADLVIMVRSHCEWVTATLRNTVINGARWLYFNLTTEKDSSILQGSKVISYGRGTGLCFYDTLWSLLYHRAWPERDRESERCLMHGWICAAIAESILGRSDEYQCIRPATGPR